MKFKFLLTSFLLVSIFTSGSLIAQSSVTFNVNLKPQLEDSTFVPGRDKLEIIGDIRPLSMLRAFQLTDTEPVDSVYSVTLNFSTRFNRQTLTYNFIMTANDVKLTEVLERNLTLQNREVSLDALYFNAFAW
ncbi:MAG: hypothetical protein RLN81_15560 [Balneolaceae bacterium]